jgi:hypothetical protein
MRIFLLLLAFVLAAFAGAPVAAAQGTEGAEQAATATPAPGDNPWMSRARRFLPSDEGVPRFTIVFGGIKPGSGVALGPAVGHNFASGGYAQATAEYSIHQYKLLQLYSESRRFAGGRLTFAGRLRWQDAPSLPLFELGPDAREQRALYGETKSVVSGAATFRVSPQVQVSAGVGGEWFRLGPGRIDSSEDEALQYVPDLPGLGTRPHFIHGFVAAGIDTRATPVSHSGSVLNGAVHRYADRRGSATFSQYILEGQQLVPFGGDRGVIDLSGVAWVSRGRDVPFYLMPWLGGGDYLRGYRTYRFRDRDAITGSVEGRWRVHPIVDALAFVDVGAVGPSLGAIRFGEMRPTQGIGVSVRTDKSQLVSASLAHSREGFAFVIHFWSRASAVF